MQAIKDAVAALQHIVDNDLSIKRYEKSYAKNNMAACLNYFISNLEGRTSLDSDFLDKRYQEIQHIFYDRDYAFQGTGDLKDKVNEIISKLKDSVNQGPDMSTTLLQSFERVKQANSVPPTKWPSDDEMQKAKRRSEEAYPLKASSRRRVVSKPSSHVDKTKSKPSI